MRLRLCAALFGLAIGVALLPHFAAVPAPPGQLPGWATAHGFDAGASFRFFASLVLLTIAMPLLLRPLLGRLREPVALASWAGALWFATIEQDPLWVVAIGAAGTVAALLLRDAKTLRFRRADAILVPTFVAVYIALIDIAPSLTVTKQVTVAAALVFVTRVVAGSADAFALAPLALLPQTIFAPPRLRHFGWAPLLVAVVTPLVLRFVLRPQWQRRVRWAVAWVIFPLATLAFASVANTFTVEGKPRGDLFEDAHRFVPASEMLRGEKPYRDIVPAHGLIDDGLLDYVTMRTGPVTAGRVGTAHGFVSMFNALGSYALATAATGSAAIGILSYFLAVTLGVAGGMTRILPAVTALSFMVAAARRGRTRLLVPAGALVIVAGLTSLDFGVYALVTLLVTVALFPLPAARGEGGAQRRVRGASVPDSPLIRPFAALRATFSPRRGEKGLSPALAALTGLGAAGGVALLLFAAFGIFTDFFRTTFLEILPTAAVYNTGIPRITKPFPDLLVGALSRPDLFYLAWPIALILFATVRNVPIRIIAAFVTVVGISYLERHDLYYIWVVAPLIAASIALLFRRARPLAYAMLVVVLLAGQITGALASLATLRTTRGLLDPTLVEVTTVPRARGTLYRPFEARTIEEVDRYARERMGVGDTFYDFADRGNLFFLLDRDCPVRHVEVSFYESEKAQRGVIATIDRNPHIRAALVPATDATAIDGVPNSLRAPLVWRYLQANFAPDVAVGEIVIWRRLHYPAP